MNYSYFNEKRQVVKTIKTYEPSSLITNHNKSIASFCNKQGKICKPWHNQSDRAQPSNEQPDILNQGFKYIGGDIKHGNYDRYLRLNRNNEQVTNTNYVDPLTTGFTVTSSAPAALNTSGGKYIFLAIA